MNSKKTETEDFGASHCYLRFSRGVGHTTALIAAAKANPSLRIVAFNVAARRINSELGREQAVTPDNIGAADGYPTVFDNAVVENLIAGFQCDQTTLQVSQQV